VEAWTLKQVQGDGQESGNAKGAYVVHGDKALIESRQQWPTATIRAHAARGRDFKRCCLTSGRFDGAERASYWRE
jgi:hypothetical protein